MEYMRDGKLHYFVKDAEFIFDGGNFQELVKAGSGTDIEVDYQMGIICSNLSNRAGYYYLDKRQGPSSYGIENRYSASYVFCSRKQGAPVQEKKEGYADLVKSTLNLTGAVAYLRPSEGSNGSSGMFADLYASNSTVNAFFDMSGSMIRGMMLAPSPVAGTHTHMSYFSVIEDNARYAYVGEKRHDFVRQYDASGSDAAITVIGDTLVQQSPTSRVTIFGPGTEALKNYEATLYETGT
jgi:hypothetical protein